MGFSTLFKIMLYWYYGGPMVCRIEMYWTCTLNSTWCDWKMSICFRWKYIVKDEMNHYNLQPAPNGRARDQEMQGVLRSCCNCRLSEQVQSRGSYVTLSVKTKIAFNPILLRNWNYVSCFLRQKGINIIPKAHRVWGIRIVFPIFIDRGLSTPCYAIMCQHFHVLYAKEEILKKID